MCGLCGNFDDNAKNDFVKHNGEVVTDPNDFGNSWKVDSKCQDNTNTMDWDCNINPHRKVRAIKRCNIINSEEFQKCNASVSISINFF